LHPGVRPHSVEHGRVERGLIQHVLEKGWLEGKLKPRTRTTTPKAKPDERALKYARTLASIKRWESKQKRATNALAKLNRSRRAMERHQAKREGAA
jgi:hypothetical protein